MKVLLEVMLVVVVAALVVITRAEEVMAMGRSSHSHSLVQRDQQQQQKQEQQELLTSSSCSPARMASIKCIGPNQVVDPYKCICMEKIDCAVQPEDDLECVGSAGFSCATHSDKCVRKCHCDIQSAHTNQCPPCFHKGQVIGSGLTRQGQGLPSTCSCKCAFGYMGAQCQYSSMTSPQAATDKRHCSRIDCQTATIAEFFVCAHKCIWCRNKMCKNLGLLDADCNCKCVNSDGFQVYDPARNCEIKENACSNHPACANFFKSKLPGQCEKSLYIQSFCPEDCKKCTPPAKELTRSPPPSQSHQSHQSRTQTPVDPHQRSRIKERDQAEDRDLEKGHQERRNKQNANNNSRNKNRKKQIEMNQLVMSSNDQLLPVQSPVVQLHQSQSQQSQSDRMLEAPKELQEILAAVEQHQKQQQQQQQQHQQQKKQ